MGPYRSNLSGGLKSPSRALRYFRLWVRKPFKIAFALFVTTTVLVSVTIASILIWRFFNKPEPACQSSVQRIPFTNVEPVQCGHKDAKMAISNDYIWCLCPGQELKQK